MNAARCAVVALTVTLLGGCERGMHDMYDQRRYKPLVESPVFTDGKIERPQPDDTVAASGGAAAGTSSGRGGTVAVPGDPIAVTAIDEAGRPRDIDPATLPTLPASPGAAMLARGRERFDVFCVPCHSPVGDGDGMVVRRGFPRPPSYHTDRLRHAPDAHFYSVITHGYGAMYPFADRIAPDDRWAIVAYIRALQRSQDATIDDVPADRRASIAEGTR